MITGFRHAGLVVANLDRALVFWCDVLGFRVEKRMNESGPHIDAMLGLAGVELTTVKLAAPDGNLIELLHFQSHLDRPTWQGTLVSTGLTHLAFTVTDLDGLCRRLAMVGVTFNAPPVSSPDGRVRVTFGQGPDGVWLELVEQRNA